MISLQQFEEFFNAWADMMWSTPLVILLVGGGCFFMVYSRFQPYRYFGHGIDLLRGKFKVLKDDITGACILYENMYLKFKPSTAILNNLAVCALFDNNKGFKIAEPLFEAARNILPLQPNHIESLEYNIAELEKNKLLPNQGIDQTTGQYRGHHSFIT